MRCDGWVNGIIERRKKGWKEESEDGWKDGWRGWMDGQKDGRMTDECMHLCMDEDMKSLKEGRMYRWMNGRNSIWKKGREELRNKEERLNEGTKEALKGRANKCLFQ